jgi:hypothetical protein
MSLIARKDKKRIIDTYNGGVALAAAVPKCVEKSDGAVLTGDDDLFVITGGPVLAQIFGIVTTIIGGASNGTLQITTTTPAAKIALSTTVAIDTDAAGTSYSFTGVAAGTVPALYPVTGGGRWFAPSTATFDLAEFLLPIGTVSFGSSAAQTGVIKWYMIYKPLSPNSVVTAAA